jgi:hypothetical protein
LNLKLQRRGDERRIEQMELNACIVYLFMLYMQPWSRQKTDKSPSQMPTPQSNGRLGPLQHMHPMIHFR